MRQTQSRQHNQARVITLILLALLLWGCAGKPPKKEPEPDPQPPKQQTVEKPSFSLSLPPSSYQDTFNSAEQALARFDWMGASVILQAIPPQGLTTNDRTYIAYLQARIAFIQGNQDQALSQLNQLNYPGIHSALRYRILSFKHYILEVRGDSLESARLADQILRGAPTDSIPAWKRNVWLNLERTDGAQLAGALPGTADTQWRGWLELALINRDVGYPASAELSRWRNSHPQHPAANPLPGGLEYLLASGPQSGKVALLLPLSGKLAPAGNAILKGYMAAYYADRAAGRADNELLVIDMNEQVSASGAYDEAVRQGAGMIVGPLSKDALADLATRLERPVPILALNRIDQILPASGSALVQLSLSPEDEAISLAELAFGTGARSALIISPAGEWGSKMETTLRGRWADLGGSIAESVAYTGYDDYSSSVKSALSLESSEQRSRDLEKVLRKNIEFTPRRRQDIDVIFLLSPNGAEARSIKPILAFHYAGDIPVYAPSSIYNGVPSEHNKDLNGTHLAEIPWLLGVNPGLRVSIAAADANGGNYTRLNALGADAYLMQSEFSRLQSGADALMRGNTGLLSMDPNLNIRRELSPATIDGGTVAAQ